MNINKKRIEEIVEIAKTAGYLKRIKRTGWMRIGVKEPESVAEHIFRTAFLAMILGQNRRINRKKLLEMALIHDLGEALTSDIRCEQGKKFVFSEKKKNELEEKALRKILLPFDKERYFLRLWYEFRDQSSSEAGLLKQIDKIEMALQAREYEEMGMCAGLFDEFIENAEKYVKDRDLRRILNVIKKQRGLEKKVDFGEKKLFN